MSDELPKVIAARMTKIRKAQELSQALVAKRMGISQQSYDHYEKGIRDVPIKRIHALSEALGVSVIYLMNLKSSRRTQFEISLDRKIKKL